jgi:hypothetical protein
MNKNTVLHTFVSALKNLFKQRSKDFPVDVLAAQIESQNKHPDNQ